MGHGPKSRAHMCKIPYPGASDLIKLNNTGLGKRVWSIAVGSMVFLQGQKEKPCSGQGSGSAVLHLRVSGSP